ncbi:MAG: hypothetical protein V1800_13335 [Candidatus Latescibacterota bacterium]
MNTRKLGSIMNNDSTNILMSSVGAEITPAEYKKAVGHLLDARPGVLAQAVGMPDPVIYRTQVATTWDKYTGAVSQVIWPDKTEQQALGHADAMRSLLRAGTDPLTLTVEACRERGVPVLASYRMNAEDFYDGEMDLYDFGREHKNLAIPGANCLDPAHREVFAHRMAIFAEVAHEYDIDGIEFDFRRWYHMVSDPLKNHPILTRMVSETREMLSDVARRKGRDQLLLGARVGPKLDGPFVKEDFPGAYYEAPTNQSCTDLGLDVRTWVQEGLVDYLSPTLFVPLWPGLPRTREFADLTKGTSVGVYPTLFSVPYWVHASCPDAHPLEPDDLPGLMRYKRELCELALTLYEDGADGISTFNWLPHHQPGMIRGDSLGTDWGLGALKLQMHIHPLLSDRDALVRYLDSEEILP